MYICESVTQHTRTHTVTQDTHTHNIINAYKMGGRGSAL